MVFRIRPHEAAKKYAAPIALILFCEILTGTYLLAALKISATSHFWLDEVLAVWVARLPTAHDVTVAIWNGAEFSPPTYDLLLHALFGGFGSDRVIARLPSVLAILGAAVALASIVWTRLDALFAALAFGLVLNSPLFEFATQARPYALLTAIAAVAVFLWSTCRSDGDDRWRPAGIALLLFASMSLHVYAVVTIAVFAVMEALWSSAHRRIRPAIWLALTAAAAASAVWYPLIRHLAVFNNGDTAATDFYGAPNLSHLADHIGTLFVGSKAFALFLLAAGILVGGAHALAYALQKSRFAHQPAPKADDGPIVIIGVALLAALPIGFTLALAATHVFSARYALAATLGAVLLAVVAIRNAPYGRGVAGLLCPILCVFPLLHAPPKDASSEAIALIQKGAAEGPIVVGDAPLFIELMESAEPALRSRLVYLTQPPGTDGDLSGEHQVDRLFMSFRPDLPVREPLTFLAAYSVFADVSHLRKATDVLSPWLVAKGWVVGVLGMGPDVALFKVQANLSHAQHP